MFMGERIFFSRLITKDLTAVDSDRRLFEGVLTVEMKDKQNEITIRDELLKVLPVWMARGAPITDTHSNRVVGKGINFASTSVTDDDGNTYPSITIQGEIFKDYELDDEIWKAIRDGTYKGLSFGGATKSDRRPIQQSDGSIAYALKDLEQYEVAVCEEPAVPLALITQHNHLAKAMAGYTQDRGNGLMVIKCSKFGCYVDKSDDKDNVDTGYGKLKNGEPYADVMGGNKPEDRDEQSAAFKKPDTIKSKEEGVCNLKEVLTRKDGELTGKSSYGDHQDNKQDTPEAEELEAQQSQGPNQDNGSTYRGTSKISDPNPEETDPKKIRQNAESAGRSGFDMYKNEPANVTCFSATTTYSDAFWVDTSKGNTIRDNARRAEVEHANVDESLGTPEVKAMDEDNKEMLEEADLQEEKKLEHAHEEPCGPERKHKIAPIIGALASGIAGAGRAAGAAAGSAGRAANSAGRSLAESGVAEAAGDVIGGAANAISDDEETCKADVGTPDVDVPSGKVKKPSVLTSEQEYDKHIQRKRDINDKVKTVLDILNLEVNIKKKRDPKQERHLQRHGHYPKIRTTNSPYRKTPLKEECINCKKIGDDKEGMKKKPSIGSLDAQSNIPKLPAGPALGRERVPKEFLKGGEEGCHTVWTEPARGGFAGREPGITRDDESRSIHDVNQPKHVNRPTNHEAADALKKPKAKDMPSFDKIDAEPNNYSKDTKDAIDRIRTAYHDPQASKLKRPTTTARSGSCGTVHPHLDKAYLHDLERQLDHYQMKEKLRGALAHLDNAIKEHRDPQLQGNNSEDGINGKLRTNIDEDADAFEEAKEGGPFEEGKQSGAGSLTHDVVNTEGAPAHKDMNEKIIDGKKRPSQVIHHLAEKDNPAGWEKGPSKQKPGIHPATDEHHEMVLGNVAPSRVAGSRHHSRAGGISTNSDPSELEEQGGVVGGIISQREANAGKSVNTIDPGMGSGGIRSHYAYDNAQQDTAAKDQPRKVIQEDYGGPTDSDNGGDNQKFNKAILDVLNLNFKLRAGI